MRKGAECSMIAINDAPRKKTMAKKRAKKKTRAKRNAAKVQTVGNGGSAHMPMILADLAAHLVRAKIVPVPVGLERFGAIVEAMDFLVASNGVMQAPPVPMPRTLSGFRYGNLELAHLAASLVESGILERPRRARDRDGNDVPLAEDVQRLLEKATRFVYDCGDVLQRRNAYWREAHAFHEGVAWGRENQTADGRAPLEKVISKAGLANSKLNEKQLASIGIASGWKALPAHEQTVAMFRFLTREKVVSDDGLQLPDHKGRTLTTVRGPMEIADPAEWGEMAESGVPPEKLARVIEFLKRAKELKEHRQHKAAAVASAAKRQAVKGNGGLKKAQKK